MILLELASGTLKMTNNTKKNKKTNICLLPDVANYDGSSFVVRIL